MLNHKYKTLQYGFKCLECDLICISEFGLKLHAFRRHGIKEPKIIKVKANLEKGRKVKCDDCGAFVMKGGYYMHKRLHKGEIECEICHAKFNTAKSLQLHLTKIHKIVGKNNKAVKQAKEVEAKKIREELPATPASIRKKSKLKCDDCGKMVGSYFLTEHRQHHEMVKSGERLKCTLCDYRATWKTHIRKHYKDDHKGEEWDYEIFKEE
jgi:DNA-directed RNA polymerase subunit M/transcription elongation factor TFIIS